MNKFLIAVWVLLSVVSCRTAKETVIRKETENLAENKLFKNIYANELDYKTLYSKKMDVSLTVKGRETGLKGAMKMEKDRFVWLSLTAPLGIEVARILFTPDSIKFMDSYNKKYLLTDYSYIYEKSGLEVGFQCIQNIFANGFVNLENCGNNRLKEGKFKYERTKYDYVLSNVHTRAIDRKIRKYFKKKRKNKDVALVLQEIHIAPDCFRPYRIVLKDMEDGAGVETSYEGFTRTGEKLFPGKIVFDLVFNDQKIKLEIVFSRLEFDGPVTPNFKIPAKYENMAK
ncbi:MAG: DUF4292 domain-containing protein [Culturomica sp.]|jgi:hypothetical protein|nr:DUF4292 domain-containing protein [Culturomica sp.]